MLKDAKVASEEGRAVSLIFFSGDIHIYEQSLPDYKLFISNHDHQDRRHVAMMLDSLSNLSIIEITPSFNCTADWSLSKIVQICSSRAYQ